MSAVRISRSSDSCDVNPWSFRSTEWRQRQIFADLNGRPASPVACRRGGVCVYLPPRQVHDLPDSDSEPGPERSMLAELHRRVSAEIAKYRTSGLLSPKELRTVEALWVEGRSLRALARTEGVAAQAIGGRIERLKERAPRFYHWWRLKNRSRARR